MPSAVGEFGTGEQALRHGLVDELGNLHSAIDKARELAKLPPTTPYQLIRQKGKPIGVQMGGTEPRGDSEICGGWHRVFEQPRPVHHAF